MKYPHRAQNPQKKRRESASLRERLITTSIVVQMFPAEGAEFSTLDDRCLFLAPVKEPPFFEGRLS
jgi:hypothetical protein